MVMQKRFYRGAMSAVTFISLLTACGGAEGGSGGAVTVPSGSSPTPTPSATPTPTPTPSSATVPTPAPTPTNWGEGVLALYDEPADVTTCTPGKLKASVKADFLARLNAIRSLHGLSPVVYANDDEEEVVQAALIMASNGQLSHTPPTNWRCYNAIGAAGAASSNLVGGTVSPYLDWSSEDDFLGMWLTELAGSNIGHRRWILDPFLGRTAYSRVSQEGADGIRTDAAAMKVFTFSTAEPIPANVPDFVAYPYGNYPARYVDKLGYLSFSAIASKTNRGGNGAVNFSNATVTMTTQIGTNVQITNKTADNINYGVPNSLQWRATGLISGATYTVKISGIAGAPQSEYTYSFRIVD